MLDFIKKFMKSEIFRYILIGFLTTVVNILVFQLLLKAFNVQNETKLSWKFAEVIAFIIAVLFAFICSKFYVFRSIDISLKLIGKEFVEFVSGRIVTELVNFGIMWYMIDKKNCNELLTKIIASFVVIVLNYLISKFIVFKKSSNENAN